ATARFEVAAGDELTILTPGGGGFGGPGGQPLAGLSTKNRGFDLPLHALLRGRRAIHGHRPHTARAGALSHEPGVEFPGLARGEAEQQVELALREGLWTIHPLIGDDEVRFLGARSCECSLRGELIEEILDLGLGVLPSRWPVVLQRHPAGPLLDTRRHEERQAPRREVSRFRGPAAARGERTRAYAVARASAHREQRVHPRLREARPIGIRDGHRGTQART